MRSFSEELQQALESNSAIFGTYTRITRKDGQVIRLVDLDIDSVIDGQTYYSASGTERTAVEITLDLNADNVDLKGLYSSELIDEDELLAGAFNHAYVEVFIAAHGVPGAETIPMLWGYFGQIEYDGAQFKLEINCYNYGFSHQIGAVTSPICRDQLGGPRCKINLDLYRASFTVTQVVDGRTFRVTPTIPSDYALGTLLVTSGLGVGSDGEVKTVATDLVTLYLPLSVPPAIGDTIRLTQGCPGTKEACKTRFNNLDNMDAEPDLPGSDEFFNPTIRRAAT